MIKIYYKALTFIYLTILFPLFFTFFMSFSFAQSDENRYYDLRNVSLDLDENNLVASDLLLNLSTSSNKSEWSSLIGKEIEVDDDNAYIIISNMSSNSFAVQSHVAIEGFNKTSEEWSQISQCPKGIDGPLETNRFVCNLNIESNITKIRPIFNAGYSSANEEKAVTFFGDFYLIKKEKAPIVYDNDLKIQQLIDLSIIDPIAMDFLGPNDILIADRDKGLIYRITNGTLIGPLLDVDVANKGLYGLSVAKTSNNTYVFIYYKESGIKVKGDDLEEANKPKCNCLYRYELVNNQLVNPELFFALPSFFNSFHNGGVIRMGPDNNLYLITGEMDDRYKVIPNKARNFINGPEPDGTSGILRFDVEGNNSIEGILGENYPLNHYYAYGIRNGFGMDFDPVTGNLWDTENGNFFGDEINLVEPGFNSGHFKTAAIWDANNGSSIITNLTDLVDFQGRGNYSSPELSWKETVGPVALTFLDSSKLGMKYNNTMFVSDVNNENIYNFKLHENRTGLQLVDRLDDGVADNVEELSSVMFASGLGIITDIRVGPDGFLYLLSIDDKKLFRIVPADIE